MKLVPKPVIFDGTNLLYRSAHQIAAQSKSEDPVFSGTTVLSVVNSIRKVLARFFVNERVYLVWDDDNAKTWRKAEYPEYKSGRKPMAESSYKDKERCKRDLSSLLPVLGIRVLTLPNQEADDTIGYLARLLATPCLIVSSDKDFLQLVEEGHAVFFPDKERYVDEGLFFDYLGMTIQQFRLFRAVVGDSSDAIKGVMGVGEKSMQDLFAAHPGVRTLDGLCAAAAEMKGKRFFKILTGRDIIERNLRLMAIAGRSLPEEVVGLLQGKLTNKVILNEVEAGKVILSLGRDKAAFEVHRDDFFHPFRQVRTT